jgi:ubiquinone/menaquinone biosynthesis C-methylase UbiE
MISTDTDFAGSIPGLYDRCLGPLLFEPYARVMALRAKEAAPADILETAAGTGIVTQALHNGLPEATIVATDLNPAMLEIAKGRIVSEKVTFLAANALELPFEDSSFDLVACQFGLMFFPDRVRANAEVRRVLRQGGRYLALVWDDLEKNPASQIAQATVASLYERDPPSFLSRVPFAYFDKDVIRRDLVAADFADITIETIAAESDATNAQDAATGLVAGCPLRSEIEDRDPAGLDRAVRATAEALEALQTSTGFRSTLSAHLIVARK